MNIQIKNNTMEQLKRIKLPLLVIDGCVDPYSDAYVMNLYEKGYSFSTLETALRQILLFYRYCNKHNINFYERMTTLDGLDVSEIEAWYSYCKIRFNDKDPAQASTIKIRLQYSWDFIDHWFKFFRDRAKPDTEKFKFATVVMNTMETAFNLYRSSPGKGQNKDIEGLSPELRDKFFLIIYPWPENNLNPWKLSHIKWRNYVLLMLLILTGPRRGETLLLETDDFSLDGPNPDFAIKHRERPPYPREKPPAIKTKGRSLGLSDKMASICEFYIVAVRPFFKNSDKSTFMFLSGKDGGPLCRSTPNKIFEPLVKAYPEYKGKISPHVLRHSFHEMLEERLIEVPQSDSPLVRQAINQGLHTLSGGWKPNSTMPHRYTLGERKRRTHNLQRQIQNDHL